MTKLFQAGYHHDLCEPFLRFERLSCVIISLVASHIDPTSAKSYYTHLWEGWQVIGLQVGVGVLHLLPGPQTESKVFVVIVLVPDLM